MITKELSACHPASLLVLVYKAAVYEIRNVQPYFSILSPLGYLIRLADPLVMSAKEVSAQI